MIHAAKVINSQLDGDSAIVITARCCDDSTTDSRHRIQVTHEMTKEQISAAVEADTKALVERVSKLHENRCHLASLVPPDAT